MVHANLDRLARSIQATLAKSPRRASAPYRWANRPVARLIAAKGGRFKSEAPAGRKVAQETARAAPAPAAMMAPKSAAASEAPPTRAPSTFGTAKMAAAFPGFTEPP